MRASVNAMKQTPANIGGVFGKPATFLVGHFGSGKTEIALNAALTFASGGTPVTVVDLDVVKPYFRTRSAAALLQQAGIEVIAPLGEYFSADIPIVVPAVRDSLHAPGRKTFLDAGGDDLGVRVVGSLRDCIVEVETDFFLVLNFRRPFTPDVESAVAMARRIESAARFPLTGIVSNTHLMQETTPEVVLEGYAMARETASRMGLPLKAVAVEDSPEAGWAAGAFDCPVLPLRRIVRPPFEGTSEERSVGPLFVVG